MFQVFKTFFRIHHLFGIPIYIKIMNKNCIEFHIKKNTLQSEQTNMRFEILLKFFWINYYLWIMNNINAQAQAVIPNLIWSMTKQWRRHISSIPKINRKTQKFHTSASFKCWHTLEFAGILFRFYCFLLSAPFALSANTNNIHFICHSNQRFEEWDSFLKSTNSTIKKNILALVIEHLIYCLLSISFMTFPFSPNGSPNPNDYGSESWIMM